jgi:hypothetical protein
MEIRKIMKYNLRRLLVEKGYEPSGTVMADLLGSKKQYWQKILSDSHPAGIGPAQRKRLAEFLDVDESEFLKPIADTSAKVSPQSHDPTGVDPTNYLLTQIAVKLDQVIAAIRENSNLIEVVKESHQSTQEVFNQGTDKIINSLIENKHILDTTLNRRQARQDLDEHTETILKALKDNKQSNDSGASTGGSERRTGLGMRSKKKGKLINFNNFIQDQFDKFENNKDKEVI